MHGENLKLTEKIVLNSCHNISATWVESDVKPISTAAGLLYECIL